jgi:large subunit ribosomal protein L25
MEIKELACEKREVNGRARIRELRRSKKVPAVFYGAKSATAAVTLDAVQLAARMAEAAGQRLIRIKSANPELDGRHVIFKEIQREPVSGRVLHVDLYNVDMSRRLKVAVPLKFVGRAAGIVDGGILQPLAREIEVECAPLEIPEFVEVDVSALGIHDAIHVSALNIPGDGKAVFDSDYAVVSVLPPTVAEVPAAAVAAPAAEAAPAEAAAAPAPAATPGPSQEPSAKTESERK